MLEIAIEVLIFWNLEARKRILYLLDFGVTSLGDRYCALEHIWNFAENTMHFIRRLDEELIAVELKALAVMNGRCGLDA